MRGYAMTPLEFEPDSKYQYSNAGINTAGRIIEVVSRMPYEEFLDRRLFKPLGMKDTTFWPNAEQTREAREDRTSRRDKTGLEAIAITQLALSAQRSQAAADACRRAVFHGRRSGAFLPDDPQWRGLRREAIPVGIGDHRR